MENGRYLLHMCSVICLSAVIPTYNDRNEQVHLSGLSRPFACVRSLHTHTHTHTAPTASTLAIPSRSTSN